MDCPVCGHGFESHRSNGCNARYDESFCHCTCNEDELNCLESLINPDPKETEMQRAVNIIRAFVNYHADSNITIPEVAIAEKFLEKFQEKEGE